MEQRAEGCRAGFMARHHTCAIGPRIVIDLQKIDAKVKPGIPIETSNGLKWQSC
jgi:hypothetical protein